MKIMELSTKEYEVLVKKGLVEEDKKIENFLIYYDDILEEYIVETKINGNRLKEHFRSPYEQMVLNKFNEIIDYINNKD